MAFVLVECLLLEILVRKKMSQAKFARLMKVERQFIHSLIIMERIMSYEFAVNASFILECDMSEFYRTDYVD